MSMSRRNASASRSRRTRRLSALPKLQRQLVGLRGEFPAGGLAFGTGRAGALQFLGKALGAGQRRGEFRLDPLEVGARRLQILVGHLVAAVRRDEQLFHEFGLGADCLVLGGQVGDFQGRGRLQRLKLDLQALVALFEQRKVLLQLGYGHLQVAHLRFLLDQAGLQMAALLVEARHFAGLDAVLAARGFDQQLVRRRLVVELFAGGREFAAALVELRLGALQKRRGFVELDGAVRQLALGVEQPVFDDREFFAGDLMHALQLGQLFAQRLDLGAQLRVVGAKILVFGAEARVVLVRLLARVAFVIEKRADARAFGPQARRFR